MRSAFGFLGSELASDGVGLAFLGSLEPGTVSSADHFLRLLEEACFMGCEVDFDRSESVSSLSASLTFLLLGFSLAADFNFVFPDVDGPGSSLSLSPSSVVVSGL